MRCARALLLTRGPAPTTTPAGRDLFNVFFSIGAGLVLLLLGAYGRLSGGLPDDNPYRPPNATEAVALPRQPLPTTAAELAVDRAMAAAEVAVAQGAATPGQARRVAAISGLRTHEDRRRAWMAHDD